MARAPSSIARVAPCELPCVHHRARRTPGRRGSSSRLQRVLRHARRQVRRGRAEQARQCSAPCVQRLRRRLHEQRVLVPRRRGGDRLRRLRVTATSNARTPTSRSPWPHRAVGAGAWRSTRDCRCRTRRRSCADSGRSGARRLVLCMRSSRRSHTVPTGPGRAHV